MGDRCAERFISALLWHCAHNERGAQVRDELKGLCLRKKTQQVVAGACGVALATGRHASTALGHAAGAAAGDLTPVPALHRTSLGATAVVKGAAAGLLDGVRE